MDVRRPAWRMAGRRFLLIALLFAAVGLTAGLVAVSPLALSEFRGRRTDWGELSSIGQTYGAASALLSAFALIGVTASLVLQSREAKASREQTLRALHGDLLKLAMDDPLYRACWGSFFASDHEQAQRAHMYVNQIINHWLLMWELRSLSEAHLRGVARVVLAGSIGNKFWRETRELRAASAGSRRERSFNRILDDEFRRIATPPPPVYPADRGERNGAAPPDLDRGCRRSAVMALVAGAAISLGLLR